MHRFSVELSTSKVIKVCKLLYSNRHSKQQNVYDSLTSLYQNLREAYIKLNFF